MKCVVIGGGIIGLSSAYYLQQAGHEVIVIDQSDMSDGCSYGNAGYVCPSHFIPLAAPNVVRSGLKWMMSSSSPFYIQPRFSLPLMRWGREFIRHSNAKHAESSAIPLRDISLLSQRLVEADWLREPGFDFSYQRKGLLEMFKTEAGEHHAQLTLKRAKDLGLDISLLDKDALQALEPQTRIAARGALLFSCDGSLDPGRLMHDLKAVLAQRGVIFRQGEAVTGFDASSTSIKKVLTATGAYEADQVILAAGSWSGSLATKLRVNIPVVAGRGYSVTLKNSRYQLNYPAILLEGRVAVSPMSPGTFRFGGTMEVTAVGAAPRLNRVAGIVHTLNAFFPDFNMPVPEASGVWYGYRPCSADGLPYIGRLKTRRNCIVATGHSMLGLSLGAGTGKLVAELVDEKKPSIDISAYAPERFSRR